MKKFLIIQTAFIGDVILATPIIEKLHQFFPEAIIDFVLRKGNESLFENHPYINEIIIWNKKTQKYLNLYRILQKIRKTKYDYIINIQRFFLTGLLTAFSGAETKIGFNKNPLSFLFDKSVKHIIPKISITIHETDRNLKLIEHITDNYKTLPKLYIQKKDSEFMTQYKINNYFCIAPTSVWFTKQYPIDKWIEFVNSIENDCLIYLIGAKDDFAFCENIINNSKNKKLINLAGSLTLLQTASLMKDARMNFVNDSAPLHIASATNAAVAAIYCSTVPAFGFGPLSEKSYIIETEKELKCRPCGLHGYNKCPKKHFNCAYYINNKKLLFYLT